MSNKQKVIVFGNEELSALNYFHLTHDSPYEVVAFTVDEAYLTEPRLFGLPVVPFETVERVYKPEDHKMSLLIGFRGANAFRSSKYSEAKRKGFECISYISSKAMIWPEVEIGENSFVHEGATVEPFAAIGNNVVISAASFVGHHTRIGDHCFLSARSTILGSVVVEPYCVIGANATVIDRLTIARETIVGAGGLITKDSREGGVYVGATAELLPRSSKEFSPFLTWSRHAKKSP